MPSETKAPLLPSRDWLINGGRELMRFWNSQGPTLPPEGEAYRAWWKATMAALEDDLFAPGDVFESLQRYAQIAREWWERENPDVPAPPVYVQKPVLEGFAAPSSWVLLALAGVVVLLLVRR